MTEPLRFIEPRVDFLDPRTGKISRQWYLFLQGIYSRVGGAGGFSTDDLALGLPDDAGVEELKADVYRLRDETRMWPAPQPHAQVDDALLVPPPAQLQEIQHLHTEIAGLQAAVAELTKAVAALQQGTEL